MRKVGVYFNDVKAGVLTEAHPGQGYVFKYDDAYVQSEYPGVSVNLPKRSEAYESEYLFPFFTNMLPEGGNKRVICRSNRLDEDDLFGLLTVMAGADFIGAVNVRRIEDE